MLNGVVFCLFVCFFYQPVTFVQFSVSGQVGKILKKLMVDKKGPVPGTSS